MPKLSNTKPAKTERTNLKAALKARGHKDADLAVLDDMELDRKGLALKVIEMQRKARKGG